MPIYDKDIDLTIDRRFGSRSLLDNALRRTRVTKLAMNRKEGFIVDPILFKRSSMLPWNCKKVEKIEQFKLPRSYEDPLSDDFGCTLRVSYDNTVLCFGKVKPHPLVLEEFFMETIGFYPYSSIGICFECGRKYVNSLKDTEFMWGVCSFHSTPKIPWGYARREMR